MKIGAVVFVMLLSLAAYSQASRSFSSIDWKMQSVEAPTPDSLGRFINANFIAPLQKVRAVYSWITGHISYNTSIYKPRLSSYAFSPDPLDTAVVWPSGDEMVARKVMRKRTAVCDGYAKLFKVLCSYAGVEAEIVQGYARVYGNTKFKTNHSWNAVKIDSAWHLIDVTWASGYLSFSDDYVQKQNDFYFLTPPEQFIYDHYPEELRWALLPAPPTPGEFKKAPFRSKNFYKYGVATYLPNSGLIEAAVGDTIHFSVQLNDIAKAKQTSSDPFMDTATYAQWPLSCFVNPQEEKKNLLAYSCIVQPGIEWLHLVYNGDVIMQYKIAIRREPAVTAAFNSKKHQ